MIRAIFDTNVLVAGLRSRTGASFALLQLARARRIVPVVSTALFFEYEDVLSRPGMLPDAPAEMVSDFLAAFLLLAEQREIYYLWRPMLTDPNDEMLVELVMAAGSDVPIITLNTRDCIPAVERLGLRVLTPAQAARIFV